MVLEQAHRLLEVTALKANPNIDMYFLFKIIILIPLKSQHLYTLLIFHRFGHYILNHNFAILFSKLVASFRLLLFLGWAALNCS